MQQFQPNQTFPQYAGTQYTGTPQYAGYTPTWRPQFGQAPAPTLPVNGTTKVSGPESALQYGRQMPPNSTSQALFDTSGKVFYIVSTDGAGTPSLETFDFSPHVEEQPAAVDWSQYVSRRDYDALAARVAALEAQDGIHAAVPAGTADGTEEPAEPANVDASVPATGGRKRSGAKPRAK